MSYQKLLKEEKIKVHQSSSEEIKDIIEIADRDLSFAKEAMAHNWDWAFTIAYNAALSASRAYMYKRGYRPSSAESHKTVWRFMLLALLCIPLKGATHSVHGSHPPVLNRSEATVRLF